MGSILEAEEIPNTEKEAAPTGESLKNQDESERINESKSQFKIGRSVSLTRTDAASSKPRGSTPSRKPKVRDEKKLSFRDRKSRFEDPGRNQRSVKELTKNKRNGKNHRQQSPDSEKEDLASILKEMRAGFRDLKGNLAKSNLKMDAVGNKIDTLEKYQKDSEKKIYKEMGKIKEDMRVNNETLDMKIKETINENLNPKCEEIKNFISADLRRIVNEEIELR